MTGSAQASPDPRAAPSAWGLAGYLPVILACLALGAHAFRAGDPGLALLWVALLGILAIPRRWAARVLQIMLLAGAAEWVRTAIALGTARAAAGLPWGRMALILGAVALGTAGAALVFRNRRLAAFYRDTAVPAGPSVAAFLLVLGALAAVQILVTRPIILIERFIPGAGWLEALGLAVYAAFVAERMLAPRTQSKTRRVIWGLFSFLFFAQLVLGMMGIERLLMTGELHLPVPALVVAGPFYRGGGLFMLILFSVTVLLVGPAWCSHLCYIGAWDSALASRVRRPSELGRFTTLVRALLLLLVVGTAFALGRLGAPGALAAGLAATFGLLGVGVMVFYSRRRGVMVHCVAYCPTGLLATWLGRISPFRMRIRSECNDCLACSLGCRYDALREEDIRRRRPGPSCTLCGDCVGRCRWTHVEYRFPGLSPAAARGTFIALVTALHAIFLGVAML